MKTDNHQIKKKTLNTNQHPKTFEYLKKYSIIVLQPKYCRRFQMAHCVKNSCGVLTRKKFNGK